MCWQVGQSTQSRTLARLTLRVSGLSTSRRCNAIQGNGGVCILSWKCGMSLIMCQPQKTVVCKHQGHFVTINNNNSELIRKKRHACERMPEPHPSRGLPAPDYKVPRSSYPMRGIRLLASSRPPTRLLTGTSTDVVQNYSSPTQNSFTNTVRGIQRTVEICFSFFRVHEA
jgi:hypothetical protein